jgi:hypothetical protein
MGQPAGRWQSCAAREHGHAARHAGVDFAVVDPVDHPVDQSELVNDSVVTAAIRVSVADTRQWQWQWDRHSQASTLTDYAYDQASRARRAPRVCPGDHRA